MYESNRDSMAELEESAESSEWDNVLCLPIIDISQTYKEDFSNQEFQFVTCKQLDDYIFNAEISQQLPNINAEQKITNLSKLFQCIFCRRLNINGKLKEERNRIFAIAFQVFDNRDKFHSQCLHTIYSKLTGNVINGYRRFGSHWEEIGFQGTDPTTDFRGVGILGLFQLTYFVVSPEAGRLCKEIYNLSLDSSQHFPFAVMSMNISQIALQVLREGLLNNLIHQEQSALSALNHFYFGTFLAFYKVWTQEKKTIIDTGYVLKDLRKLVRQNVSTVAKECVTYKSIHEQQSRYEEDFTNIGNIN